MAMSTAEMNTAEVNTRAIPSSGTVLLDPTGERETVERALTPRLASLEGLTVGLLDISKPRGNVFLDQLQLRLQERGISTKRYKKPTYTKPAPIDLRHEISLECQAVIEALAD